VLRLQAIAESIGYTTKKDHIINERVLETSSLFNENCLISGQFWRLDLAMKRKDTYVIIEVQGGRHESKIVQGKDRVKAEDVPLMLRDIDPCYICWRLDSLIGKYKNSDDKIKNILNSPNRFHGTTID
jgi:hypothetical protein